MTVRSDAVFWKNGRNIDREQKLWHDQNMPYGSDSRVVRYLSTWFRSMCQRIKEADARVMAEAEADRQALNDWLVKLRREPLTLADLALVLFLTLLLATVAWAFAAPMATGHQVQTDSYFLFSA